MTGASDSSQTYVDYRYQEGVARITLVDGGRGNPIHLAQVTQLHTAVHQAVRDEAGVIVLAAEGRFFSVGGDLSAFADNPDVGRYIDDLADALHRVVAELQRCDSVVVSVVQGAAAGAGFPLAAAADVVLAGRSVRFSLGYTRVGLSVDGGTSLLVSSLGLHRTLRLALLNDTVTAEEAAVSGLVARVFEDAELAEEAEKVIGRLAAGPARAQAATKRLIRTTANDAPERALDAETRSIRMRAAEPDGVEGVRAFLDKRAPDFG